MKCPKCGDKCTGIFIQITVTGVMYADFEIGDYPELAPECAEPTDLAQCMDCDYIARLNYFYSE